MDRRETLHLSKMIFGQAWAQQELHLKYKQQQRHQLSASIEFKAH